MLDTAARERMIAKFDMDTTRPEWVCGPAWDIVLGEAVLKSDMSGLSLWRRDGRRQGPAEPVFCDA